MVIETETNCWQTQDSASSFGNQSSFVGLFTIIWAILINYSFIKASENRLISMFNLLSCQQVEGSESFASFCPFSHLYPKRVPLWYLCDSSHVCSYHAKQRFVTEKVSLCVFVCNQKALPWSSRDHSCSTGGCADQEDASVPREWEWKRSLSLSLSSLHVMITAWMWSWGKIASWSFFRCETNIWVDTNQLHVVSHWWILHLNYNLAQFFTYYSTV